jgi:hypothetical protein
MSEPVFTPTRAARGFTVAWKDADGVLQTLPLREFQPPLARTPDWEEAQEIADAMNMAYEMGRDHGRRMEPEEKWEEWVVNWAAGKRLP